MERLVKQRRPIRAMFTKTYNDLTEILSQEIVELEAAQKMQVKLERLSTEISLLDEKILDLMIDGEEEAYTREYNAIENYRDNLDEIRLKMNNITCGENANQVKVSQSDVSLAIAKKNLKLPRLELDKFEGDVKNWLGFWSMFKRIHEDSEIESEDKFQYLIQCTKPGSRARELVNSFPATAENYPKVIESMKNRFGREDLLTEYYIRELIGLVVQNVSHKKRPGIAALYDKLESQLRALESIGVTRDKYGSMLFPLVESCLPEEVLRAWIRNQSSLRADSGERQMDKLEGLLSYLKQEVEGEERIAFAQAGFGLSDKRHQDQLRRKDAENDHLPTANSLFSAKSEGINRKCVFCCKLHESQECHAAQQMSLEDKRNILAKNKCCFSCLKPGHRSKRCKTFLRCHVCNFRHVVIMCPKLSAQRSEEKDEGRKHEEEKTSSSMSMNNQSATKEVLLQTLCVKLIHKDKVKIVRALIDSGSQRSYISQKTADEMGYLPLKTETMVHKLFGGIETHEQNHRLYEVNISSCDESYSTKLQMVDQKIICGKLSRLKIGPWMEEIKEKKIWLSDIGAEPTDVEVLFGADAAGILMSGKMLKLRCGLVAIKTTLGWTITGTMKDEESCALACETTSLLIQTASITDLWNLEAIGISDPMESKSREEMEEAARHHFQNTVKVNDDGRYEVALPWLDSRQFLQHNREMAEKRLISTTNRLIKEGRYHDYEKVFEEWIDEGVIEEVPKDKLGEFCYYLPHRGVFKENSTTKVRPVFDGSCKSKDSPSLNDCLEKGPNLLLQIPALLLMFRKNKIGVISDIRKAFLQISVQENDRDSLRFLWWKNQEMSEMKTLRHCRVVFGLNCSPFLLAAVLDLHLKNCPEYQETARLLRNSFYVDNCITSVNDEEELHTFMEESTALLAQAQFDLRNWEHTSFEPGKKDSTNAEETTVLGFRWNKSEDTLSCEKIDINIDGRITRRSVLAAAQRIFDPVGFSCPVSLVPKLLLQESWKKKMSWDEDMEDEMKSKFEKWLQEIEMLSEIKIPRQMAPCGTENCWSLHTFCDASCLAYAAVVFLRAEDRQDTYITLLQAKTRVAPLKKTTVSRLELLACSIGARLAYSVKTNLGVKDIPSFYWTDSMTALCWIKRKEVWGTFVANRVKEIKLLSDSDCWRHVPGVNNPADLPSRGCSASKLLSMKWWEGPLWLRLHSSEWPVDNVVPDEEKISEEKRKGISSTLLSSESEGKWYLRYFSKYTKVVRMTGWMLRFIHNARAKGEKRTSKTLQPKELQEAERTLWKIVKEEEFKEKDQSFFKSLKVFEDENGVLRVKTSVTRRADEKDFLTPILLPSNHKLVHMLILEKHLELSHAGVQVLLSILRERFWVINGRRTIRRVISRCVRCRRHQAKGITTESAPLPEDRVRDALVFEIVGVDLAGPLHLRGGEKAWIVIFTCAVFRAVHFELIQTLSTVGFLQALRRFIARRGRPNIIYSDNGKNFVGTENAFSKIDWTKLSEETSMMRIVWKFNPPSAAWWGGFWERIVQMLKRLLRRVLGRSCLNYEEMLTVLLDAEANINSRPLTYVSEDPEDLVALTPSMFLQEIPRVGVPDLDHIDQINHGKRFRHQQHLRKELRKRFRVEYLGQLKLAKSKTNPHRELEVGEVVIIGSDNMKRIDWPLGKVVTVYPGKDNIARVARVKTACGELDRPVKNLYPLEVPPMAESQSEEDVMEENYDVSAGSEEVAERVVTTRRGRKIKLPTRLNL